MERRQFSGSEESLFQGFRQFFSNLNAASLAPIRDSMRWLLLTALAFSLGCSPSPASDISFCADTSVADTCAESFFSRVASCFHPVGQATSSSLGPKIVYCWESGAELVEVISSSEVTETWLQQGLTCLTLHVEPNSSNPMNPVFHYQLPDGTVLSTEAGTGVVICPNGSQTRLTIDMTGTDCPALNQLTAPFNTGEQPVAGTCS